MADGKMFTNRCYGIVILRSENSNWNADFTKYPRRLPDENGTIFATDKSLKYSVRKYWVDNGQNVFVWRTFRDDGKPRNLEETYDYWKERFNADNIKEFFNNFIDVKFFGITFAVKDNNLSITGPLQISYGVNRYFVNTPYVVDIGSPFRVDKEKDNEKKESSQTTLGNEIKNLKSYYVYDFVLNPRNLPEKITISDDDIRLMKEALKKSATYLNSVSKMGTENALLLFVKLKEDSELVLPTMKNIVKIENDETLDLSGVASLLSKYTEGDKSEIEEIEVYYNENITKVKGIPNNWKVSDILL
ncbi:MAG: type I CRISPR-associated protein Cas7 [Fervidobacterium sp.]|uniref:type I CRISPR-associated protein Cas7 n=1 Tax=Fervidobacterium TaxID=2422 RepID=UPI0030AE2F4A